MNDRYYAVERAFRIKNFDHILNFGFKILDYSCLFPGCALAGMTKHVQRYGRNITGQCISSSLVFNSSNFILLVNGSLCLNYILWVTSDDDFFENIGIAVLTKIDD